ncbi:UDP-N-acetyl-D-mannosaminuronic acid dehydrogenase [Arthrobacter ginsengisoli]|uniref:UDP-N-acetyl-D-mannosaminuronic acid dehydrogenase n=1 Tax=Arthrobacter ginsengisoli TaxID=1356565 RepID=A0ABU1UD91_9MICC|nr:UDP-N-acetyl-D-mannosamine dehydrogenase [Arthrobacter ginsengisoli]MDR7083173.1 UDP-N-acetyl-D-mannosaminuronic acid dehydrogenase [Arthrobacter ginsengisoli]
MTAIQSVVVVGLGYIGLPTAAILATHGLDVTGVDVNSNTVEAVNRGAVPFVEPDLEVHVAGAVQQGRLQATTLTPSADAFIVAVPTPFGDHHEADLSYIRAAAESIAPVLKGGELIVLESTSPPGATRMMSDLILRLRPDLTLEPNRAESIYVAHCPERVLPGRVMIELVTNDRIIGGLNGESSQRAKELYSRFCKGAIHLTDSLTAEMAKLVENSYRDVNIAFANELSMISDDLNIDVWRLIELANHHPRVNILQPGPGVGGHCIAVDPWFIVAAAPERANLIRAARQVNDSKPAYVTKRVMDKAQRFLEPRIAVLGLAFKPDIDDLRESPAREIVNDLALKLPTASIFAVEPHVQKLPPELEALPNVSLRDLHSAVDDADIVVLLVDHTQNKDFARNLLNEKIVIDTKGVWR